MITVTLNKIKQRQPCNDGWKKLVKSKKRAGWLDWDQEFPLSDVIDSNGVSDAVWCMRALPEHEKIWRNYAIWCAKQTAHLQQSNRIFNLLLQAEELIFSNPSNYEAAPQWPAIQSEATAIINGLALEDNNLKKFEYYAIASIGMAMSWGSGAFAAFRARVCAEKAYEHHRDEQNPPNSKIVSFGAAKLQEQKLREILAGNGGTA